MRKMVKATLSTLALTALGFAAPAEQAAARTAGGFIGYPVDPAARSCMTPDATGVFNGCGGTRRWEVILTIDDGFGSSLKAKIVNNFNVANCFLITRFPNGATNGSTNGWTVPQSVGGGFQSASTVNAITLPAEGNLALQCDIPAGGQLKEIRW